MNAFEHDIFDLADIALDVAARDPDRIAVIEPDGRDATGARRYRRHSYRKLSDDVESVAVGMRELGIAERTRTVFMAPPSYDAAVVGLALTRVGATTVWIDPAVGYRNVAERLRRLQVEAFVGISLAHLGRVAFGWGHRFLSRAIVIGAHGFPGAHDVDSLRRTRPAEIARATLRPDDPAAIMYTTGSTGPAKPVLYPHRQLCNVFRLAHRTWRFAGRGQPVDMPVFPAFFAIGLSAGGTIVVPPIHYVRETPEKVDPRALLEVIRDCGVQTLFASPVILENLSRLGRDEGATAPSLHTVIGGGAPLYAPVIAPLQRMLGPGGEVHADYGATEALPVTEMPSREALDETFAMTARGAGLCVGRPFPGVAVKVIAIDDEPIATLARARQLAVGEVGELVVQAPHISPAYADDATNTARNKIADDRGGIWHRLGDAGYVDAQGRVWCCGRVGHRIVLPDGPLFPLMCEPIFDAHPSVRRSGLVGVAPPGVTTSIVPIICVELVEGTPRAADALARYRDELLRIAAQHAPTRAIRHVLFHPRLPVDPRHNSKIERPELAKWAAQRFARAQRAADISWRSTIPH